MISILNLTAMLPLGVIWLEKLPENLKLHLLKRAEVVLINVIFVLFQLLSDQNSDIKRLIAS